jgi:hypothetical protein
MPVRQGRCPCSNHARGLQLALMASASALAAALPAAELASLTGRHGHKAIDSAPGLVVRELRRFLDN